MRLQYGSCPPGCVVTSHTSDMPFDFTANHGTTAQPFLSSDSSSSFMVIRFTKCQLGFRSMKLLFYSLILSHICDLVIKISHELYKTGMLSRILILELSTNTHTFLLISRNPNEKDWWQIIALTDESVCWALYTIYYLFKILVGEFFSVAA